MNFLRKFSKYSQEFLDTLFIADGGRERKRERGGMLDIMTLTKEIRKFVKTLKMRYKTTEGV